MTGNIQTKLDIKVHPGAGKNEITGFRDGVLNIKVTARPEKGKANTALVNYLSSILGISKSSIEIAKGSTSRLKTVAIEGLDIDTITGLIEKAK
ncbi:MAG: DUF167 domain-containing protein [Dehalococcoidales bacterium]|nr:DUF167 domain-containing protein [Dehalococcoidales bacterium]